MSTEQANGPAITIANGPPIPYWGVREHMLKVTVRSYKWTFLLEATTFPILGTHCLQKFDLMVDLKTGRLFKRASPGFINLSPPPPRKQCVCHHWHAASGPNTCNSQPLAAACQRQSTGGSSSTSPLRHRLYKIGSTTSALQHWLYNSALQHQWTTSNCWQSFRWC